MQTKWCTKYTFARAIRKHLYWFSLFKVFGNTLFAIPYNVRSARVFDWNRYFDRCFLNNYIGFSSHVD